MFSKPKCVSPLPHKCHVRSSLELRSPPSPGCFCASNELSPVHPCIYRVHSEDVICLAADVKPRQGLSHPRLNSNSTPACLCSRCGLERHAFRPHGVCGSRAGCFCLSKVLIVGCSSAMQRELRSRLVSGHDALIAPVTRT
jgi:hypothetical protein